MQHHYAYKPENVLSPDHVHNELLKLNGVEFHGRSLILEEAMSPGKKCEQQRQRQYHKRPQVVVNNFSENQDTFKKPNVMSGNSTSKNEETYCNKNSKVFLVGDSHLNRIKKEKLRKEFKGDWVYFKCFPGANIKQSDYCSIPMLVDEKPNTTIVDIASNDITKLNYHTINADELAKGIMKISSDKTRQQHCISELTNIMVKNVNNVIMGTLNINSLTSKFDKFKLVVSRIFDILIITETKLDNTFPTSQFYIECFLMPYRLDRNRNGGGIIIYFREDIPTKILTKQNLPEDIEGIFLEINFRKSKWLLCRIYHPPSQNDEYFFDNLDKALDICTPHMRKLC